MKKGHCSSYNALHYCIFYKLYICSYSHQEKLLFRAILTNNTFLVIIPIFNIPDFKFGNRDMAVIFNCKVMIFTDLYVHWFISRHTFWIIHLPPGVRVQFEEFSFDQWKYWKGSIANFLIHFVNFKLILIYMCFWLTYS